MRHHSRQQFPSHVQVKVSNPRNGALIGYIGDVSESGIKIFSDLPFVRDERMRMTIHNNGVAQFALDAICRWSDSEEEHENFAGGFYLVKPPAGFTDMVKKLRSQRNPIESTVADKADSPPASLSA